MEGDGHPPAPLPRHLHLRAHNVATTQPPPPIGPHHTSWPTSPPFLTRSPRKGKDGAVRSRRARLPGVHLLPAPARPGKQENPPVRGTARSRTPRAQHVHSYRVTHTHTCRNTRPETHTHATPHAQQTPEQQLSPRRRRCSSALIPPQSSKTCPPAMARQQPPIGPSSGALQPYVVRCQPAPALAHCLASAPPSVSRLRRGSTIGDGAATVMCGREGSFGISFDHG